MFGTKNVYAMVTNFQVRVKDEREKDRNHLVETTFEVPLTPDLAEEILPAMVTDLYMEGAKGLVPRPELADASFNLTPETQNLEIRNHPDLDPDVKLDGVTIRKVKAKKGDGGGWLLLFTTSWVLAEQAAAIIMIQRLKLGVYLSFQVQEPKLPLDAADQTVDGQVVGAEDGPKPEDGAMVPAAEGKRKRGRPKGSRNKPKDQVAVVRCQECGTEVPAHTTHCPQCGARIIVPALPATAGPDATGDGQPEPTPAEQADAAGADGVGSDVPPDTDDVIDAEDLTDGPEMGGATAGD